MRKPPKTIIQKAETKSVDAFRSLPEALYKELEALDILETLEETETLRLNYRIFPTEKQRTFIHRNSGCNRKLWNLLIERLYAHLGEDFTGGFIDKDYKRCLPTVPEAKALYPYMSEGDAYSYSNTIRMFHDAVAKYNSEYAPKGGYKKRALKRVKNGGVPLSIRDLKGIPSYHAKHYSKNAYTTSQQRGNVRVEPFIDEKGNVSMRYALFVVPKLDAPIRMRIHRPIPANAEISFATLERTGKDEYMVSICVSVPKRIVRVKRDGESMEKFRSFLRAHVEELCLGLDYAQEEGCVSSNPKDGMDKILAAFDKTYCKNEAKLAALQRKLAKKCGPNRAEGLDPSKEWLALNERINRLIRHIANIRKDALEKLSRALADKYFMIAVEDIDLRAMSQTLHLAKRLLDNGFGMFRQMLKYKLEAQGKFFSKIDKWFPSSQQCHNCGEVVPVTKDLTVREWTCPHCGHTHNRDENAALNIRDDGIAELAPLPEKKPSALARMRESKKNKIAAKSGGHWKPRDSGLEHAAV